MAGAWLTGESTCEIDASDTCGIASRAALDWLQVEDPAARVVSIRWAQIPREWADSTGRGHHLTNGSLFAPSVAILTLAAGEVRLLALLCGLDIRPDAVGTNVSGGNRPTVCSPQGDVWGQYLVGAPRPPETAI